MKFQYPTTGIDINVKERIPLAQTKKYYAPRKAWDDIGVH